MFARAVLVSDGVVQVFPYRRLSKFNASISSILRYCAVQGPCATERSDHVSTQASCSICLKHQGRVALSWKRLIEKDTSKGPVDVSLYGSTCAAVWVRVERNAANP